MCHWFFPLCIHGLLDNIEQVIILVLLYLALFVS